MTERIEAEEVFVDPKVAYCSTRMVPNHASTMPMIRTAASDAMKKLLDGKREAVMVEVRIWVKP